MRGFEKKGFFRRIYLGDSRALQPFFFWGGGSVTLSVINHEKSVTRSVMRCFIGLQIPTLFFSELITVTDADTDTDFNVFELDM